MGRHSALPTSPAAVPNPPRHQLRREYERLYAHYLELTGRYNDLLEACVRTGRIPASAGRQTSWGAAREVADLEQTTEEIPAPVITAEFVHGGQS